MASNSANESPSDVVAPKLTYSGLPAASPHHGRADGEGRYDSHSADIDRLHDSGVAFASVMLFPMTFAMISWLAHGGINHADEVGIFIFMALVLLFFWPTVIVIVWQAIRRRRMPTICTLAGRR